eukprot:1401046-Karenia_brevis.AAC.1
MPPPKRAKTVQQSDAGTADVEMLATEVSPPIDDVARSTQRAETDAPSPKRQKTDDVPPPPPPFGAPTAHSGSVASPVMMSLGNPDAITFKQP